MPQLSGEMRVQKAMRSYEATVLRVSGRVEMVEGLVPKASVNPDMR
jgi:hypothetical protein